MCYLNRWASRARTSRRRSWGLGGKTECVSQCDNFDPPKRPFWNTRNFSTLGSKLRGLPYSDRHAVKSTQNGGDLAVLCPNDKFVACREHIAKSVQTRSPKTTVLEHAFAVHFISKFSTSEKKRFSLITLSILVGLGQMRCLRDAPGMPRPNPWQNFGIDPRGRLGGRPWVVLKIV